MQFRFISLIILCICAACIPAKTPPQLAFTPGAPVIVTDQIYQYETYQVAYPVGWRVITSAAETPGSVTFAAPDNQGLIFISPMPIHQPPALPDVPVERLQTETRVHIVNNDNMLYIALVVDEAFYNVLYPVFESILATIEAPRLFIPTDVTASLR